MVEWDTGPYVGTQSSPRNIDKTCSAKVNVFNTSGLVNLILIIAKDWRKVISTFQLLVCGKPQ